MCDDTLQGVQGSSFIILSKWLMHCVNRYLITRTNSLIASCGINSTENLKIPSLYNVGSDTLLWETQYLSYKHFVYLNFVWIIWVRLLYLDVIPNRQFHFLIGWVLINCGYRYLLHLDINSLTQIFTATRLKHATSSTVDDQNTHALQGKFICTFASDVSEATRLLKFSFGSVLRQHLKQK